MEKVFYLINDLDVGGAEVFLERLIKGSDGRKFDPTVISILPAGIIGKRMASNNIRVISLSKSRRIGIYPAIALFRLIKSERPDILNCSLFHSVILGRVIGKVCGVKNIISVFHSDKLGSFFKRWLLAITDIFTDYDIAVSQKVAQSLLKNRIVDRRKLKVINPGVDVPARMADSGSRERIRNSLNISDSSIVITAVGRLHEAKGYFVLMDAAKILVAKYPSLKFLIIGEGGLRKKIESRIREYSLGDKVELLGLKSDLGDYLTVSDIYVLPSLWEGFSYTLIEAMSFGLPPVAAKVGIAPEAIESGKNGFLAEAGDPADLAGKLEKLVLMSREERKKIGLSARETVEENYSIIKMASEYEKLYN